MGHVDWQSLWIGMFLATFARMIVLQFLLRDVRQQYDASRERWKALYREGVDEAFGYVLETRKREREVATTTRQRDLNR